ncbi:YraN family protein [Aliarcobacter vitoriensis]|uniref:UPF0102 protein CRU91_00900 n=1 Tax=Aliarcobacter vitoriensis TaxID=2011099 RepID=A0A366MVF0_9BACT|nr:YraN family protein [Aliarcobacter vitoriensis]RBQ30248.1 hypothetical protein CRU91_00900 [Aliarcobacter vitoriensis]RBQ32813.1 hypothetical protein CRU92_02580 [Arcobacter sp. FW59]
MSKSKGDEAEKKAVLFLKNKGFEIVETNFYAKKLGEIDIIANLKNVYHFFEVKSANDYETAILNLTKQKLSKIKRSVEYYIQKNELDCAFCIDAIIVTKDKIKILENITI